MEISRRHFGACILGGLGANLAAAGRPRILVFLVLEQFRPDYLETAAGQLSSGGFRRLVERGANFADCRHLASTFSATSIATIATGAWPAEHGIVADSWFDRAAGRPVTASDEMLVATTLASQAADDSRGRVSVIAADADLARLFAGSRNARIYTMDDRGRFALRGEAPDWLSAFNDQHPPETQHNGKWMAVGARSDAPPLRNLTYDEKHPEQFLSLYKASPFGQDALFDLLHEVISRDQPGQGNSFHLVCLLAGSMARLGYETGSHSPLMMQMVVHLDRRLETLLAHLSRSVGDNNFSLVVAGAHGAPPLPPDGARKRMAVDGEALARAIYKNLSSNGFGRVSKYVYPFLYLDSGGFRDPEPIRLAAARAAMEHPAVAGFYTAGGACSTRDEWERRFRNSFHAQRSGDVMLSYRPEYVEDFGQGRGISYGSLYNYDAQVPLVFFGTQFRTGAFENPVQSVDIAPTLSRLLGIGPPSSATGRVLSEALI
jgi:hypothetical protein